MRNSRDRPPSVSSDEFASRRERAAADAQSRGLDALLVWSIGGSTLSTFGDVFYLTNHYPLEPQVWNVRPHWTGFGAAAVLVPASGEAALLVGAPDWRRDLVAIDDVRSDRDLYQLIAQVLREKHLSNGRIGLVRAQALPLPLFLELRQTFPGIEFIAADDLLEKRRMVKSPAEIQLMRHAQDVSVEIMNAVLETAVPGRTDSDLAATGFRVASSLGATPWEFAMSSGPYSEHAYYHRLPLFDPWRAYETGDIVHPDVWGCVDGYFYDFQRTLVVGGKPTVEQRHVLEAVVEKVHFICGKLVAGARASEVARAGLEWTLAHGWEAPDRDAKTTDVASIELYGHGIGLGWDLPFLVEGDETVLEPGMTIAVETYVSDPAIATAIYEETVLVTDDEPEIMTSACKPYWWD